MKQMKKEQIMKEIVETSIRMGSYFGTVALIENLILKPLNEMAELKHENARLKNRLLIHELDKIEKELRELKK
ncbi:MAG: hypothetical protein ACRCTZ_09375 [Sarcina sp.]